MGRTTFHAIRISRRALFCGILTALVLSAFIVYMGRDRHGLLTTVGNLSIVLDQPAPEFTLLDDAGNEYRLQTFHGRGLVLVFWTTWCPNCGETLQMVQQVHEQLASADDIALIGINVLEDGATVGRFTVDHKLRFPVLLDTDASVSGAYSIRIVPSVIIIDEYGFVRERMLGGVERATFIARLQSIIPDEGP